MKRYPIVDAHEDLAFNALLYGRDYRRSAYAIREDEQGAGLSERRGNCMLGVPELLQAGVAVVFATIYTLPQSHAGKDERGYRTREEARDEALRQFELYQRWIAEDDRLTWVRSKRELSALRARQMKPKAAGEDSAAPDSAHPNSAAPDSKACVGIVLLIENADCIVEVAEVGDWHARGVRVIGPAWHRNAYTGSSGEPGPLTAAGEKLLAELDRTGMALDISHLSDEAMRQVFTLFKGPICSSHANPRAIADKPRQLPSWALTEIGRREGVAGIMPVNWALDAAWEPKDGKQVVTLRRVAEAVTAAAELAGGFQHIGLGSDFDGGFGADSCPLEIETIADLPRLSKSLAEAGVPDDAIASVMGGNWLRWLKAILPEE